MRCSRRDRRSLAFLSNCCRPPAGSGADACMWVAWPAVPRPRLVTNCRSCPSTPAGHWPVAPSPLAAMEYYHAYWLLYMVNQRRPGVHCADSVALELYQGLFNCRMQYACMYWRQYGTASRDLKMTYLKRLRPSTIEVMPKTVEGPRERSRHRSLGLFAWTYRSGLSAMV
jgi:hypothetical protein